MTWTAPVDCYVTMRWFFNSENFDAGVRLSVPGDNNWNAFHYSHIPLPAQENTTISLAKGVTMTFGMAATNAFTPEAKPTLNEKMIGAFFFFYYYPMDHTYL